MIKGAIAFAFDFGFEPTPTLLLSGTLCRAGHARRFHVMAMDAKKMTLASSLPLLLQRPTVSRIPRNKNSAMMHHISCRGHHPLAFGMLVLSALLLFSSHGGDTEAAPPPLTLARRAVGFPTGFVGSFAGGYIGAGSRGLAGGLTPSTLTLVRSRSSNGRAKMPGRGGIMAAAGEKEEEKLELAAEVCSMSLWEAGNVPKGTRSQL